MLWAINFGSITLEEQILCYGQLISEAVTVTARQPNLEEQIQCYGLRDGGHCLAEPHDPIFILYFINNIFKNIHAILL